MSNCLISVTRKIESAACLFVCVMNWLGVLFQTFYLTESTLPKANIIQYRTGRVSSGVELRAVEVHGTAAISFTCFSDSTLDDIKWGSLSGGGILPDGVSQNATTEGSVDLVWSREISYMDSGQYQCNVNSIHGVSTTKLDLLVTREL